MTIASDVKTCIASLKGAKENLSLFANKSTEDQAQRIFHECMLEMEDIIVDMQQRLAIMEREEPQYKG